MILADTSVWIDHFRVGNPTLIELLNTSQVLAHPFVIGELACGNLKNRKTILSLLHDLPISSIASDEETLFFIDRHRLMGRGIGYIDAHLLASTSLTGTVRLWTSDKRLDAIAAEMKLAFKRD